MTNTFKKILAVVLGFGLVVLTTSSVVGCDNTPTDNIYRPDPIMPIVKKGFSNVNLDTIDVQSLNYTDELLAKLNEQLELVGYNLKDLDYQVYKNEIKITLTEDLFRNGNYKFIISNKLDANDEITAAITITNSLHLVDNFKITTIGEIYDNRPRSIMMALMFYNLEMINNLTKVASELTAVQNYSYSTSGALLSINDEVPKSRPQTFYGSLDLKYSVVPFEKESVATSWPVSIEQMVKLDNDKKVMKTDLGRLDSPDAYSLLMVFIMENLNNPIYWGLLVNDLDLNNFSAELIDATTSTYKMNFYTKPYDGTMLLPQTPAEQNQEYDAYAHFLDDTTGVELQFRYFK